MSACLDRVRALRDAMRAEIAHKEAQISEARATIDVLDRTIIELDEILRDCADTPATTAPTESKRRPLQKMVLTVLADGSKRTAPQIAQALEVEEKDIARVIKRLVDESRLDALDGDFYRLTPKSSAA